MVFFQQPTSRVASVKYLSLSYDSSDLLSPLNLGGAALLMKVGSALGMGHHELTIC